jgi:hypothetical protein
MFALFMESFELIIFCAIVQKPLLPVTVQDQIRLWELERNRLKSQEGEVKIITWMYYANIATTNQAIFIKISQHKRTMSSS